MGAGAGPGRGGGWGGWGAEPVRKKRAEGERED